MPENACIPGSTLKPLIATLERLSGEFNPEADTEVAETLRKAAQALREAQPLADAIAVGNFKKAQKLLDRAVDATETLTVLVEGSGTFRREPSSGGASPYQVTLDAILALSDAAATHLWDDNCIYTWGDNRVYYVPVTKDDFKSSIRNKAPFYLDEFRPVVDSMEEATKGTDRKPRHFVIVSDGGYSDGHLTLDHFEKFDERKKKMHEKIASVLRAYPKTTLDFVVAAGFQAANHLGDHALELLARDLKRDFPAQVSLRVIEGKNMTSALKAIAAERIGQPGQPAAASLSSCKLNSL